MRTRWWAHETRAVGPRVLLIPRGNPLRIGGNWPRCKLTVSPTSSSTTSSSSTALAKVLTSTSPAGYAWGPRAVARRRGRAAPPRHVPPCPAPVRATRSRAPPGRPVGTAAGRAPGTRRCRPGAGTPASDCGRPPGTTAPGPGLPTGPVPGAPGVRSGVAAATRAPAHGSSRRSSRRAARATAWPVPEAAVKRRYTLALTRSTVLPKSSIPEWAFQVEHRNAVRERSHAREASDTILAVREAEAKRPQVGNRSRSVDPAHFDRSRRLPQEQNRTERHRRASARLASGSAKWTRSASSATACAPDSSSARTMSWRRRSIAGPGRRLQSGDPRRQHRSSDSSRCPAATKAAARVVFPARLGPASSTARPPTSTAAACSGRSPRLRKQRTPGSPRPAPPVARPPPPHPAPGSSGRRGRSRTSRRRRSRVRSDRCGERALRSTEPRRGGASLGRGRRRAVSPVPRRHARTSSPPRRRRAGRRTSGPTRPRSRNTFPRPPRSREQPQVGMGVREIVRPARLEGIQSPLPEPLGQERVIDARQPYGRGKEYPPTSRSRCSPHRGR